MDSTRHESNCVTETPCPHPLTEYVANPSEIDAKLWEVPSEIHSEVATFFPGGAQTEEQIAANRARNREMYERGIRSRTIYLDSVRYDPATLEYVRWLNERGSDVRTVPRLPLRMIVADRRIAILPLNPAESSHGIVIQRGEGEVVALQALFELVWATATPLGLAISNITQGPTAVQRVMLDLYSLGKTDQEVGEAIRVSERTVQRRAAELMARLNARTRFVAAYQAAKRNWI